MKKLIIIVIFLCINESVQDVTVERNEKGDVFRGLRCIPTKNGSKVYHNSMDGRKGCLCYESQPTFYIESSKPQRCSDLFATTISKSENTIYLSACTPAVDSINHINIWNYNKVKNESSWISYAKANYAKYVYVKDGTITLVNREAWSGLLVKFNYICLSEDKSLLVKFTGERTYPILRELKELLSIPPSPQPQTTTETITKIRTQPSTTAITTTVVTTTESPTKQETSTNEVKTQPVTEYETTAIKSTEVTSPEHSTKEKTSPMPPPGETSSSSLSIGIIIGIIICIIILFIIGILIIIVLIRRRRKNQVSKQDAELPLCGDFKTNNKGEDKSPIYIAPNAIAHKQNNEDNQYSEAYESHIPQKHWQNNINKDTTNCTENNTEVKNDTSCNSTKNEPVYRVLNHEEEGDNYYSSAIPTVKQEPTQEYASVIKNKENEGSMATKTDETNYYSPVIPTVKQEPTQEYASVIKNKENEGSMATKTDETNYYSPVIPTVKQEPTQEYASVIKNKENEDSMATKTDETNYYSPAIPASQVEPTDEYAVINAT